MSSTRIRKGGETKRRGRKREEKGIVNPSMIYDLQLKVQVTVKQRGGGKDEENKRTLGMEKSKSMVLVW